MNKCINRVSVRLVENPPLMCDQTIRCAEDAISIVAEDVKTMDRECVLVINIRTDYKPINVSMVSLGSLDYAPATAREIFKASILSNAAGIILLHNHPSGEVNPSMEDVIVTDKVKMIGDLLGIQLLDHIIVGEKEYYSFSEKRTLNCLEFPLIKTAESINLKDDRTSVIKRINTHIEKCKYNRKNQEDMFLDEI